MQSILDFLQDDSGPCHGYRRTRWSKLCIQHWIKCIQVQSSEFFQRYNIRIRTHPLVYRHTAPGLKLRRRRMMMSPNGCRTHKRNTTPSTERPMAGLNLTYKRLYTRYIINAVSELNIIYYIHKSPRIDTSSTASTRPKPAVTVDDNILSFGQIASTSTRNIQLNLVCCK